jgi:hypothetical protein
MAAVGTTTLTETTVGSVKRVKFAWISDASGNVSGSPTAGIYDGEVIAITTIPSGGGTVPTTYTITVKDADGNDVLCAGGTTRSTTATEWLKKPLGAVTLSTLELGISGAGNAKVGTAYIWIR